MNWRFITRSGVAVVALSAAGGGAWILSLPPAPAVRTRRPREGGSRCDAHGVEAAETSATADRDHRHQRRHRGYGLPHALRHPSALGRGRRGVAGDGAGAGEALSGARGRAAGDDRGLRCAASGRRRLRHRPGHEPRRRPDGSGWLRSQAAKARRSSACVPAPRSSPRPGLLDGKRATTHWFYLKELRDEASRDPLCPGPAAGG